MKIKLSKAQWEQVGRKSGWLKAQNNPDELDQRYQEYRSQMKSAAPVYVSLYEVSKNYGGPEEGGWWYTAYELISSKKFFDREEAEAFASKLNGEVEASGVNNENLSSARGMDAYPDPSGGDPMYEHSDADIPVGFSGLARNQAVFVEDHAGENATTETPHYE